ncbi:hypothetical protein LOTGIDRAFT_103176 [Lottia gigantea]|uniref:ZZ-type domain-containing protein n=1 Tax=Lottia gigantea TaxID=225164 RepID=V4CRR0_LOTGI|nr:hypothetical protein LOTGIDRAFT_103176 [Lottia gigantea]ESP05210.1 hypothetical protein LOTGIDRAFT_103176 [Lottia gigantea]
MTDEDPSLEATSSAAKAMLQQRQLLTDMRAQNYDVIRFATYRTACKLRFIQKKTNLHLIDIWNVIQAFRENGLNSMDPGYELSASKVESILATLFTQLNKRLPAAHQIEAEESKVLLLNWILTAYDKDNSGKTRVLSIKVVLSTLCSGKLVDKLRYIFTQLSDSTGCMIWSRFEVYLRDILTLPTAVFEGPSFGFNQSAARSCFEPTSKVNINDFLSVMMADPGPQCLMWLPILTRMATVENTLHPIPCEGCHRQSFTGFRYKCDRCHNYQLCQDCFWRGRVSGNHNIDHPMKEYKSYKSHVKQLGHSIKKSFQCVPHKTSNNHKLPHFPEAPEKKIDLSYIVTPLYITLMKFPSITQLFDLYLSSPPTPLQTRNGFPNNLLVHTAEVSSIDSTCSSAPRSIESCRIDDEHRLIARYASRLAADAKNAARSPSEVHCSADSNKAQRELIGQLEAKNREIMREIQRLRLEQEAFAQENAEAQYNPTLLAELRILRQRKDELESRMQSLQESRKELMVQLETLMKLLKVIIV